VLADRYIYTAFARDGARGVDPSWVRELYKFAVRPTVAFYFQVPLEVSLKRILGARAGLKYYEAGMDLGLSDDIEDSFSLFQGMIRDRYEEMVAEFGLTVIDATRPIEEQQNEVRSIVERELGDVPKHPAPTLQFWGE
jgi:dTMP kinase